MDKTDDYGIPLCDKCEFKVEEVEKAEEYIVEDERLCSFIGNFSYFRSKFFFISVLKGVDH